MVVSIGLAAMRTRSGLCHPNADTLAASPSPSTQALRKQQQQQQRRRQRRPEGGARGCPCVEGGRKRKACCRRGRDEAVGVDRWKRSRATESRDVSDSEEAGAACAAGAAGEDGVWGADLFEGLPDDIVVCILCRLSSSASAPADLVNVMITCKRMRSLILNPLVLSRASAKALAVRAKNWSEAAQRFLKTCVDAGNLEASYILGMIRFYCLQNRGSGASLMAKAAIGSHAAALYSLAVIQFNGSGGSKNDKDLRAGVALCARAAFLGHVDALRELGHCLQDGYGVRQNVAEGRRFLVQANARELASVLPATHPPLAAAGGAAAAASPPWMTAWPQHAHHHRHTPGTGCPLLSDFGCNVPAPDPHPANRFLAEWFFAGGCAAMEDNTGTGPGLRLCSHVGCGRPETRRHEFRRCSVCGAVNYCSRACQALDWKLRHKHQCAPMDRWLQHGVPDDAAVLPPAGDAPREAPLDAPPIH